MEANPVRDGFSARGQVAHRSPGLWQQCVAELGSLASLAIPLIAALSTTPLLTLADTYFIGTLGELQLAAASLTSSVVMIIGMIMYGLLGPVGILAGQAFGAGDTGRIAQVLRHGVLVAFLSSAIVAGLMIAALWLLPVLGQPAEVLAVLTPYWVAMALMLIPFCISLVYKQIYSCVDRAWTSVILSFVTIVLQIPLTWALVGGHLGLPQMGLLGAGVANFLAQMLSLIIMMIHYHFAASMAPYRVSSRWSKADFDEQIKEGLPMAFQYLLESGTVTVAGFMIGWLGVTALAANQVVFSVTGLLYMIPLGVAGAVGIRIAQAVGSQEESRIRAIGVMAIVMVTVWTTLFTLVLLIGGSSIASAFVAEQDVIAVATMMFIAVGVMQIFDGIQSVALGALRGILDTRWPAIISLISYWLIALPLGYVLAFVVGLGAPGVWGGYAIGLAVAAALLGWRFRLKSAANNAQGLQLEGSATRA